MRPFLSLLFLLSLLPFISCIEVPSPNTDNPHDPASPAYVPRIPSSVNGILINDSLVGIYWSSLKISPGGFIIQRKSQHQDHYQTIASFPKENFEIPYEFGDYEFRRYFDSLKLKNDTDYYYRVAAYTGNNSSPFSQTVNVRAMLTNPTSISVGGDSTGIVLRWQMENMFPVFTKIERMEPKGTYSTVALLPSSETTFKDTLVLPSKRYVYRFSTVTANNSTVPTNEIPAVYTVVDAPKVREIGTNLYLNDMIVSADESVIVVSNDDGWIRTHKFSDGTTTHNFLANDRESISKLSLDASKTVLAVIKQQDVLIYNLPSEFLTTTVSTGEMVLGMALLNSAKGKYLATVSEGLNSPVKLWNIESGMNFSILPITVSQARMISIDPTGTRMVTGGLSEVTMWDLNTEKLLTTIPNFRLLQTPLFVSPNEIYSAYAGTVYELISGTVAAKYSAVEYERCFAFLPDRSLMAVATPNASLLYDLKNGLPPVILGGQYNSDEKIFFTRDGKHVFGGNANGKITFWKLNYRWRAIS